MRGTGVEGVTVTRGGAMVLQDVTLQADDGELLVVLGPSGSGKTTLLRVLAGLERVSCGEVFVRGRRVTDLPPAGRRVSMVFETSALLPFLDVSRNLAWGLEVKRVRKAEVLKRVGDRARQLRLSHLLSRRTAELSGGERGMVGIGRTLVQAPDAFLLDEPLASLDMGQRTLARHQIVEVVRSLGVGAFYVTHDQAEGLAVADRVALLHGGSLVQVGRPMDLYERPVNLVAAGFIGAPPIGLLPATLVVNDGLAGFTTATRTVPLWRPVPEPLRAFVGRETLLGWRAEDVHDATAGHDPDSVALDAVVTDVEYTGRRNVVTMAAGARPVTAPGGELSRGSSRSSTLRSFFPPRTAIRPGDTVRVAVTAARAHVFDAVSGRALWHPEDAP